MTKLKWSKNKKLNHYQYWLVDHDNMKLAENSIIETINMSIMNEVYKYLCPSLAGWSVHSEISFDTDVGAGRRRASASCHFPIPFPSLSQLLLWQDFFSNQTVTLSWDITYLAGTRDWASYYLPRENPYFCVLLLFKAVSRFSQEMMS